MTKYLEKGRLEAMSDGVFAILMTLLVLNLDVTQISNQVTQIGLKDALWHLMPEFWGFVLAFFLIATFWLTHTKQYRHVNKVTEGLIWITILGLLFSTLIPFSTSLMTEYSAMTADLFFQINILVIGLINVWQWHYIGSSKLLDKTVDKFYRKRVFYKNLVLPAVTLVVIGVTILGSEWSMLGFMLIPIIMSVFFRK